MRSRRSCRMDYRSNLFHENIPKVENVLSCNASLLEVKDLHLGNGLKKFGMFSRMFFYLSVVQLTFNADEAILIKTLLEVCEVEEKFLN